MEKVKVIFARTYKTRREELLNEDVTVQSMLQKYKMLKKSAYVRVACYIQYDYIMWIFSHTYRLCWSLN